MTRNLLYGMMIFLISLTGSQAYALERGRQFLPLPSREGKVLPLRSTQEGANFLSLRETGRNKTQQAMIPLRGGESGRVWKLQELRSSRTRSKATEVPAEVKLAMATAHLAGTASNPTSEDKEQIAVALAPVFEAHRSAADATPTLGRILAPDAPELAELETDMPLQDAVAAGITEQPTAETSAMIEDATHVNKADKNPEHAFVWPVADAHFRISSAFGARRHPITGKQDFHAGIDIPAPVGTRVLAAAQGEVTAVGEHPNLGRYVKITHADGSYSLYGHLQRWMVKTGAKVEAGQVIGRVGSTGRSTGPHLDFSLRRDGKPVNPMSVLAAAREEKRLVSLR